MDRKTSLFCAVITALLALCLLGPRPAEAQSGKLHVVIDRVIERQSTDTGSSADFYAAIGFDGLLPQSNREHAIVDTADISPGWRFTHRIDVSRTRIVVVVGIWDRDSPTDDDPIDLKPGPGRQLVLVVDATSCRVSGDVSGRCGERLISVGDGSSDNWGELWFHVEVERPPVIPVDSGLTVRCLHSPLWPQPGDTITVTTEVLDAGGAPRRADSAQVWINTRGAPSRTCANNAFCVPFDVDGAPADPSPGTGADHRDGDGPGRGSSVEPGMDRPGSDYRDFVPPEDDPRLCREACAQEERCRAWTYVKPGLQGPRPRCWLKASVPAAVRHDCCTSGTKAAP